MYGLSKQNERDDREWMPSSKYEKSMNYQLEIYGPGDSHSDEYSMEIWIPVKKIVK